jgi:hypothetical protein
VHIPCAPREAPVSQAGHWCLLITAASVTLLFSFRPSFPSLSHTLEQVSGRWPVTGRGLFVKQRARDFGWRGPCGLQRACLPGCGCGRGRKSRDRGGRWWTAEEIRERYSEVLEASAKEENVPSVCGFGF